MNATRFPRALAHAMALAGLLLASAASLAQNATANVPKMADSSQLQGTNPGDAARPSVGVPLNEAEGLIKAGHFTEALAKVQEVEKATPDMTRYERYAASRTKAAAAIGLGQTELGFDSIE